MEKELKRHYMLIVDFLGHILGPDYEIALHELNDDSNEIIAIANGELTGRHLGSPLSNKMLEYVAGNLYETQNYVLNFESVSATGKTMCSNSMFIKGRSGELAGLLSWICAAAISAAAYPAAPGSSPTATTRWKHRCAAATPRLSPAPPPASSRRWWRTIRWRWIA